MARYRPVFTDIWVCDNKFQDYSVEGKLLFLYLITNDHLEESGIYKITYKTMSNETDISKEKVKLLINTELKNNVSYDDKNNVVFVHKFLKFSGGGNPELIKKSIEKGKKLIKTTLWNRFYNYYTRDLEPLENSLETFPSNSNVNDNPISKEDKEILNLLKNTKNYPYNYEEDLKFIRDLVVEFNDVEVFEKIKQICTNWMDKPLSKKSRPRVQIRKWCLNERKWAKERKKGLMVGKNQKEPTKEEKQFKQEYDKKRQELDKKYQSEYEKAKKDGDLKAIGEIGNKIKQELAEWSNEFWEKK